MQLLALVAMLFPALMPHCSPIVAGQMVACTDGHAYVIPGWHDAGLLRREPILVPALPER